MRRRREKMGYFGCYQGQNAQILAKNLGFGRKVVIDPPLSFEAEGLEGGSMSWYSTDGSGLHPKQDLVMLNSRNYV